MSANVEAMVREGINAFKAGRREEARALLLKATELDQYNEQAWLWLSGLMETPDDQRTCLENVLAINPNNERAKQGLSFLTGQTSNGNISPFSAAPPPNEPPSTATSVEWAAPNDPAPPPSDGVWSARPAPQEPTPAILDDWVTNLNLPVNESSGAPGLGEADASSPFGDFDLNDDDFISGPFTGSSGSLDFDAEPPPPAPPPRRSSPASQPLSSPAMPPPAMRPPPQHGTRRAKIAPPREERSMLYEMDTDHDQAFQDEAAGEMFGYIPPEIPATRLPGTKEGTPILLTLGIFVLVLLNLGLGIAVALGILT